MEKENVPFPLFCCVLYILLKRVKKRFVRYYFFSYFFSSTGMGVDCYVFLFFDFDESLIDGCDQRHIHHFMFFSIPYKVTLTRLMLISSQKCELGIRPKKGFPSIFLLSQFCAVLLDRDGMFSVELKPGDSFYDDHIAFVWVTSGVTTQNMEPGRHFFAFFWKKYVNGF